MDIRNTAQPVQGSISVIHRKALCCAFFLVTFSGYPATATENCLDSLPLGGHLMDLDACRPAPVSTSEKNMVVKSLPAEGEVAPFSDDQRRKLKDLTSVLRLHGRDGVYAVKVISVPQAWTGLHARAVLLVSLPALQILSSEELQALVAHEVGHEYLWRKYALAEQDRDTRRLQELELICDGIAVLTLQRIGVKPDRLITALEKVSRFNRERFGRAENETSYPSIATRRNLIKQMSGASRLPN